MPVFLVLKLDDTPIACGGLRPLDSLEDGGNDQVEIKRMFVVPEFRGRSKGVADVLLKQLELQASQLERTVVKLETAIDMLEIYPLRVRDLLISVCFCSRHQARSIYERHGYRKNSLFAHYAETAKNRVCYEKTL